MRHAGHLEHVACTPFRQVEVIPDRLDPADPSLAAFGGVEERLSLNDMVTRFLLEEWLDSTLVETILESSGCIPASWVSIAKHLFFCSAGFCLR